MGRIHTYVTIENLLDLEKKMSCEALVDTGTSHMILPSAWRERLGELREVGTVEMGSGEQKPVRGVICGPVRIKIDGFRAVSTEVAFINMEPEDGKYEPLVGYIVLEQCQAAVDMVGHRLVHVKRLDLK